MHQIVGYKCDLSAKLQVYLVYTVCSTTYTTCWTSSSSFWPGAASKSQSPKSPGFQLQLSPARWAKYASQELQYFLVSRSCALGLFFPENNHPLLQAAVDCCVLRAMRRLPNTTLSSHLHRRAEGWSQFPNMRRTCTTTNKTTWARSCLQVECVEELLETEEIQGSGTF